MEIRNNINNSNNINFNAIKVATVKNCVKKDALKIDIYRLTPKDSKFLEKLLNKINYKELYPNLTEAEQKVWQDIFRYCIFKATEKRNTSFIAMSDNKPCGIICYAKDKIMNLLGICSIPTDIEKRTPFVGKALFYQAFNDAIESNSTSLQIEAVNDSPIDVVKKYTDLGFKTISSEGRYTQMNINIQKVKEAIKELKTLIKFKKCNPVEKDLLSTLS